ncbi:glycosyltransferase family 2 protein [Paenibacillus sp. GCM10023252]|uniref:glycosyltransferase family 2 protein n=1 Tax=Paenibacillus sp. GCM10023252 TaxID=3252649 RepID=UPI00361759C0
MSECTNRVLIASPVHQKADILRLFLQSLERLTCQSLHVDYLFIDDNVEEASSDLLSQFLPAHTTVWKSDYRSIYIRTEAAHCWNEQLIWQVASMKNRIIQEAISLCYDYLFLIDSDLLLRPPTLQHLISLNKPIISEIFWTKWQPDARPQPQVWMKDEYKQWEVGRGEKLSDTEVQERFEQFLLRMRTPGVYEVGGLGACTLMSREALVAGVHYGEIPNLSFWGEDRHFCIRAAALGIPLFVDTHYPAYHIYRDSELPAAMDYMKQNGKRAKLTLTMIVRNESGRYLARVLHEHRKYIDEAVIIDDASTDDTAELCRTLLQGIPLKLIRNSESKFSNEVELRRQQWEETIATEPEWILNLDADEMFEAAFHTELPVLLNQQEVDLYCFRLYDFWNEQQYREDSIWRAHLHYRPFLLRYKPGFTYTWKETPQHCGRYPQNIFELHHQLSALRLRHLGWAHPEHRAEKFKRYSQLDPEAKYGWKEQYNSILDENPHLVDWVE